ncbi:MAG: response regulator [Spirochaetes bacterium]|nr:response regulator [Spirochaetota bacterium]
MTYSILITDDQKDIHHDFEKIISSLKPKIKSNLDKQEEKLFGSTTSKVLPKIDFQFFNAYQGEEAVNLVNQKKIENSPFSLAIVDEKMPPGITGIETIQHIWEIDPNLPVIFTTGLLEFQTSIRLAEFFPNDHLLILRKPFNIIELKQMVWVLLNH